MCIFVQIVNIHTDITDILLSASSLEEASLPISNIDIEHDERAEFQQTDFLNDFYW